MADVIIIMGSKVDLPHVQQITAALDDFDLTYQLHVSSPHKTPAHLLQLLAHHEANRGAKVYITVAGLSNALSGMVDACVTAPVIACPPYSDKFGGADVFSSISLPKGVTPALVLNPINAALLAAKILGKGEKVREYQQSQTKRLVEENKSLQK